MSEQDLVHARLSEGRAEIHIGGRDAGRLTIDVDRRDNDARANTCPIELISAALGS